MLIGNHRDDQAYQSSADLSHLSLEHRRLGKRIVCYAEDDWCNNCELPNKFFYRNIGKQAKVVEQKHVTKHKAQEAVAHEDPASIGGGFLLELRLEIGRKAQTVFRCA